MTVPVALSQSVVPNSPPYVAPRTGTLTVLRELWRARDLVSQFVKRDVTIKYTQAFIGIAWAMLMPVLIVCSGLVFRLVVSSLSGAPVGGASAVSLAVKALPWAFFSGAISLSTQSIIAHAGLIGKIYFPRESLPLASVLAQGLDLLVGGAAVLIAMPILGTPFRFTALWGVVALFLLLVLTIGCALLLSCWNLFYRDIKYIVQVVLNFGIFATPVFFEPQMLGAQGAKVMLALPLSPFIQALDISVVRGFSLLEVVTAGSKTGPIVIWSPWMLLYMVGLAAGTLVFGLRVFRRAANRFAEAA